MFDPIDQTTVVADFEIVIGKPEISIFGRSQSYLQTNHRNTPQLLLTLQPFHDAPNRIPQAILCLNMSNALGKEHRHATRKTEET